MGTPRKGEQKQNDIKQFFPSLHFTAPPERGLARSQYLDL
jgi:hypothetical protein